MKISTAPGPTESRLSDIGAAADELGYTVQEMSLSSVTIAAPGIRITIERFASDGPTGDTIRRYIRPSDVDWQTALNVNGVLS